MSETMQRVGFGVLLVALAVAAARRVASTVDGDRALRSGAPSQDIERSVDEALPAWTDAIFAVADGEAWSRGVEFAEVLAAVDDAVRTPLPSTTEADTVEVEDRVVEVAPLGGRVRYANARRAWSIDRDAAQPAVEDDQARRAFKAALDAIGLPSDEQGPVRSDVIVGAGAPVGSPSPAERFEMYRRVSIDRRIGGLRVVGSRAHAAVNHAGEIQRISVDWPRFVLRRGGRVLSRADVVRNAVDEIGRHQPQRDAAVTAYLAYAAVEVDDGRPEYVPAVIFAVHDQPTPYLVTVPLVGTERPAARRASEGSAASW